MLNTATRRHEQDKLQCTGISLSKAVIFQELNELDLLTRQYWKISNSRSFTNGGLEVRRNWVRKKSKIISNVQDDTGLDRLQIRLIHFILKRCLLVFPTFFLQ